MQADAEQAALVGHGEGFLCRTRSGGSCRFDFVTKALGGHRFGAVDRGWRLARVLRVSRHDEYKYKGPDRFPLERRFGERAGSFVYNCGPVRRLPILATCEGLGPNSCNAPKERDDFRPQGPAGIQRERSRLGCFDDGASPRPLQHQLHALRRCGHQDHGLRGCRVGAAVFPA